MDAYLKDHGYVNDITAARRHHEIYLSDPRRTAPAKRKTVIRHPIKKAAQLNREKSDLRLDTANLI